MKRTRGGSVTRGTSQKLKMVKKETIHDDGEACSYQATLSKPSVEIVQCISYQKFRYHGENRPGKKYQEKDFMTLKLNNLSDKVVRVVIICTDADNRELIHPNGLVGKDCHDGIYDKEYAITKPSFIIKIPYLRTERIKTKKNEHAKIQNVLSDRASHLPSPYKERCLSQCTDKYTSSRKFDTTKVCLGVIVTVQSHQGPFNGSLHAISHVVRNASEKTSLNILKLSQLDISALTGGTIDIFTTEDGPGIEPDKYLVYVTSKTDTEEWMSEKICPAKEDILYKRVISYRVPNFFINPNLASETDALLHLECPQSNQYCNYRFRYVPHVAAGIVLTSDQIFNGRKHYIEHDIKPTKKRLRTDPYEGENSTEAIKASLKSKLEARQEPIYIDAQNESQNESNHYIIEQRQQSQGFNQEHTVLIRHQDPNTGESSYLLDMDASKNLNSSNHQYVSQYSIDANSNSVLQGMGNIRNRGSIYQTSQDVQVVATGYSDDVPPNTTVLIYTTNGDHVAIDSGSNEQMVIQEVSDEEEATASIVMTGERVKNVNVIENNQPASASNGHSEQVIRREMIMEKRVPNQSNPRAAKGLNQSASGHMANETENRRAPYSGADVNPTLASGKQVAGRYSPAPASSPSTIPPLRRMLIPNKQISSASAWEVGNEEDQDESYSLVQDMMHDFNRKSVLIKEEPVDEELNNSITKHSPQVSNYQPRYIAQKQMYHAENIANSRLGSDRSSKDSEQNKSQEFPRLDSMELQGAIANLPTMQVMDLANMIEQGLPSTTENVEVSG
ncbi:uncharacterized protein LOC131943203 isoform X2 [Physella acuta]|uniref:uncharacterized protein LOC131943203 isoform X2 n=1 Tax=Physella acuta TaxID=109671 RepID=UPI0027DB11B1|nr:uncharacterized protein LOC131943203 isoform X2 [Physella acuta]